MSYRPADSIPSPAPRNPGWPPRLQYLILAAAIAVFLTLGWRGRTPVRIIGGDELTYVSVSRSLETGSYREAYTLSAPRHVRYPPGYPAWLMALRKVGGESFDLVRACNLAFVALSILGIFLIARQVAGPGIGLAAAVVLSLNHTLLEVGGTLLSESPFLALTTAALVCTFSPPSASSRPAYLAITLALGAFLTRVAGFTLVIAIGAWLWARRRPRELLAFGASCVVLIGGWVAYSIAAPTEQSGWSYGSDLAGGLRTRGSGVLWQLGTRIQRNLVGYGTEGLPWSLGLPTIPGTVIDNLAWLVLTVVLIVVGTAALWRASRAVGIYMVLSAILLLLWPWRIDRLLVPGIPLAVAAILIGARRLTASLPPAIGNLALGILIALMSVGALQGAWRRELAARQCDRSRMFESAGCYDPESRSLAAAALYLREHASPGDAVLALSGAGVNHLSGLVTERPIVMERYPPGTAGRALRERGIRYVLLTGRREAGRRSFGRILLASCRDLRLEARFEPEALLMIAEPPRQPSEDACAELRRLVEGSPQ